MKGDERNREGLQPGIPIDSVGLRPSELHQWVYQARLATKELHNQDMRVSIKGDANEKIPEIQKVIEILQTQNVNKFSLITSLRGEDY